MALALDKENADPTHPALAAKAAIPLSALRSRIKGLLAEQSDQSITPSSSGSSSGSPDTTADHGGHTLGHTSTLFTLEFALSFLAREEAECEKLSAAGRQSKLSAAYRNVTNSIGCTNDSKCLRIWLKHAQFQSYAAPALQRAAGHTHRVAVA